MGLTAKCFAFVCVCVLWSAAMAEASAFGVVKGVVHDATGGAVVGAQVKVQSSESGWVQTVATDNEGRFEIDVVPTGVYTVSVDFSGFSPARVQVQVTSGHVTSVSIDLKVAGVNQQVEVSAAPLVDTTSPSLRTLVTHDEIVQTPGATDPNSLAMITSTVAGATLVHDQLHVRGGHQVSWLLDGVPLPNTNIATNVGPQIDPEDIEVLEIQRAGYPAEYGDRTYGVFDVVPRTGFGRSNDADVTASIGNFGATTDHASFGGHTTNFAYFGSLSGDRSDVGLMTPTATIAHDNTTGTGAFGSLMFTPTPQNQFHLVTTLRQDDYQVPVSADDIAAGIADDENEGDRAVVFSWIHVFNDHASLSVSPFFHQNTANFLGGVTDTPVSPTYKRTSDYAGGQTELTLVSGRQNLQIGVDAWRQSDHTTFAAVVTGTDSSFTQTNPATGGLAAAFVEDQITVASGATLSVGVRATEFNGVVHEHAVDPRIGLTVVLPHQLVARASYGAYYQAPPLDTVIGSLADFATAQGLGFLPLHGERDRQFETGLSVPVGPWSSDVSFFWTQAHNFFDHNAVGNSNIFLPLTIDQARIRGFEATVTSPSTRHVRMRLVYSLQWAEGAGAVTGGLTDFSPPAEGYFFLDHDQRQTATVVLTGDLPHGVWLSGALDLGSGFLTANGPAHLPAYYTVDVAGGRDLGSHWTLKLTALNLTNQQYFVDQSNTFGGTHFSYPRRGMVQLTYKFKY